MKAEEGIFIPRDVVLNGGPFEVWLESTDWVSYLTSC